MQSLPASCLSSSLIYTIYLLAILPDMASCARCCLPLARWENGLRNALGLRKNRRLPWGGVGVGQLWDMASCCCWRSCCGPLPVLGFEGLVLGSRVGEGHSLPELVKSWRLCMNVVKWPLVFTLGLVAVGGQPDSPYSVISEPRRPGRPMGAGEGAVINNEWLCYNILQLMEDKQIDECVSCINTYQ